MSRIGKKPVAIPSGVTVEVKENVVTVRGKKGELSYSFLPEVSVQVDGDKVVVTKNEETKEGSARHGLTRQLIQNMVIGVSEGFVKKLEIVGVGYKAQANGKSLTLNLGYSHPIHFQVQSGVEVVQDSDNKNVLVISGIDKQKVGQVASDIRAHRPPEPYKGKGIKYVGEYIIRKVGKAAGKGSE